MPHYRLSRRDYSAAEVDEHRVEITNIPDIFGLMKLLAFCQAIGKVIFFTTTNDVETIVWVSFTNRYDVYTAIGKLSAETQMKARKLPPRPDAAYNPNKFWINLDMLRTQERLRVKAIPLPAKNPLYLPKVNAPILPSVEPKDVVPPPPLSDILRSAKIKKDIEHTINPSSSFQQLTQNSWADSNWSLDQPTLIPGLACPSPVITTSSPNKQNTSTNPFHPLVKTNKRSRGNKKLGNATASLPPPLQPVLLDQVVQLSHPASLNALGAQSPTGGSLVKNEAAVNITLQQLGLPTLLELLLRTTIRKE